MSINNITSIIGASDFMSSYYYAALPLSSKSSPMHWVPNFDIRNCSGFLCPPDTLCMRPEHFALPTNCVHKHNLDFSQNLAKGPYDICNNNGIVQNMILVMLLVILAVQVNKYIF